MKVRQEWSETQATSAYRLTGQRWSTPYLALDGRDADPNGLLWKPVTVYTWRSVFENYRFAGLHLCIYCIIRAPGFMEFDITEAMRNWRNGDPNYGVLLRATNENDVGRDVRFYSNAERDKGRHAHVTVLCD